MECIYSSVFSVSPSRVFTYQWAHTPINCLAPTHRAEECQTKRPGEKENEAGKEALWKVLI